MHYLACWADERKCGLLGQAPDGSEKPGAFLATVYLFPTKRPVPFYTKDPQRIGLKSFNVRHLGIASKVSKRRKAAEFRRPTHLQASAYYSYGASRIGGAQQCGDIRGSSPLLAGWRRIACPHESTTEKRLSRPSSKTTKLRGSGRQGVAAQS